MNATFTLLCRKTAHAQLRLRIQRSPYLENDLQGPSNNYKTLRNENSFGAHGYLKHSSRTESAYIARCNLSSAGENWPKVRSWLDAILISLVKSSWLRIVIARPETSISDTLARVSSMNFKILISARPLAELYPTKSFPLLLLFVFRPCFISCVSSPR